MTRRRGISSELAILVIRWHLPAPPRRRMVLPLPARAPQLFEKR